jgi:hypothetical protein
MALNNFSTDLLNVTVNGRQINDWGETEPAYTDEPIDPKSTLRRGQGGNACRLDRLNPGRTVNLYINPGSPDSAYLQGLFESNATITLAMEQIGTLEIKTGTEGVMVNDGQTGRGGQTITDDQFIIEFNTWTATKGGA